jgi:hypothetical protein
MVPCRMPWTLAFKSGAVGSVVRHHWEAVARSIVGRKTSRGMCRSECLEALRSKAECLKEAECQANLSTPLA